MTEHMVTLCLFWLGVHCTKGSGAQSIFKLYICLNFGCIPQLKSFTFSHWFRIYNINHVSKYKSAIGLAQTLCIFFLFIICFYRFTVHVNKQKVNLVIILIDLDSLFFSLIFLVLEGLVLVGLGKFGRNYDLNWLELSWIELNRIKSTQIDCVLSGDENLGSGKNENQ